MGGLRILLLGFSSRWLFLQICGDLEPHLLKFGEVITVQQKAVFRHPWKNLVHQLEVPHWDHREGFPGVKINKRHLVIAWHGDLREQVIVLSSPGNYQMASMVFLPVGLEQVSMLEQGTANAGIGA